MNNNSPEGKIFVRAVPESRKYRVNYRYAKVL